MNIIRESIDELNAIIKLNIEKSDYEPQVEKVLKDHQRKASMPGFRPGKVPFGMIKRMYGTAVLVDEMNKLVSENVTKYITDNNLELLGEPLPNESQETLDLDNGENFEVAFDIALSPQFEINLSKKDKIPFYRIVVTDELIDKEIEVVKRRSGSKIQSEKIGEKSVVKGMFVQVDNEGNELENGIVAEDSTLAMSVIKDEDAKNLLLDKTPTEFVVFDVCKAFPNEVELSYLLKITKEEVKNVTGNFKFVIGEITDFIDAELNQELFDKIYGQGNVSSTEEMKTKIKENLESIFAMESDFRFQKEIRKYLIDMLDFKLPEEFLKRWMKNKNKEEGEYSDDEFPQIFNDLRWQLIVDKILKTNSLTVDDEDALRYAKKNVKMEFMQYGLTNVMDEHIENYAAEMLKDKERNSRYYNGAIFDKAIDYIKNTISIEEKEISREDFNKFFEEE